MATEKTIIDALGEPCPVPVVKARGAIAALPAAGGTVEVLVDNTAACENLGKMAAGLGHACATRERPDGNYAVTITVAGGAAGDGTGAGGAGAAAPAVGTTAAAPVAAITAASQTAGGGLVVAIGADCMGRGSEELGRILVKGFIFSLSQLPTPPTAVLFFNSGVRLTLTGANTVPDLALLAEKGTRLLVCGTCADYYQCRDKLVAGRIVTMYDIVEAMAGAGRVVSI